MVARGRRRHEWAPGRTDGAVFQCTAAVARRHGFCLGVGFPMHGCRWFVLLLPLALGCSPDISEEIAPPEETKPPAAGSQYDPGRTGTIHGNVTWTGDRPQPSQVLIRPLPTDPPNL